MYQESMCSTLRNVGHILVHNETWSYPFWNRLYYVNHALWINPCCMLLSAAVPFDVCGSLPEPCEHTIPATVAARRWSNLLWNNPLRHRQMVSLIKTQPAPGPGPCNREQGKELAGDRQTTLFSCVCVLFSGQCSAAIRDSREGP